MLGKRISEFQIFGIMVVVLFVVGCGGKKAPIEHYETTGLPSEEVTSDYLVEEEPFEAPASIEEQELEAMRSLKASAEKQGALEDVHFAFNDYSLEKEAQAKLQRTAQWLQTHPAVSVVIEGHCDERGSQEYNLALGERRAVAVEKYVQSLGVAASRMETVSYGEERPVDPASNEVAWAKNRRAHFDITSR